MPGPITVDLKNAAGTVTATARAISAFTVERLDKLGDFEVVIAAADPAAASAIHGGYVAIYIEGETYPYQGMIERLEWPTLDEPTLKITGPNLARELARRNGLLGRVYDGVSVTTIINDLLTGAGWTTSLSVAGMPNVSIQWDGKSLLENLDQLAKIVNGHWRQRRNTATLRLLDWGAFSAVSGITLLNAEAAGPTFETNPDVGLIESINVTEDSAAIINSIVALGQGEGNNRFSMRWSDRSVAGGYAYNISSATGPDGKTYYYVEDAASVTAYGRRQVVLVAKDIGPVANSSTAFTNASNALYDLAVTRLQRGKDPQQILGVRVARMPTTCEVGDSLSVKHVATAQDAGVWRAYKSVNAAMIILERRREWPADGGEIQSLVLTNLAKWFQSDQEILIGALETLEAFKTAVKLYTFETDHGTERESIQSSGSHWFSYPVEFDGNVSMLLKTMLRVRLKGLKANSTAAASGGSSTSGGGSSHSHGFSGGTTTSSDTHSHTLGYPDTEGSEPYPGPGASYTSLEVPFDPHNHQLAGGFAEQHFHHMPSYVLSGSGSHSHGLSGVTSAAETSHTHSISSHTHTLTYGIFQDSLPATPAVSVWINGTNRTVALGGPFNADFQVDVTAYLIDANGHPLRQENTIEFRTTATAFDVVVHAQSLVVASALAVA